MLSTTQELTQAREHYRSRVIPAGALALMDREAEGLVANKALGQMLAAGMEAPDFLLPGADGVLHSLRGLTAEGPAVLVFYRGGWCPYCNIHLRGLQRELARIEATGARLVAISPQLPDASLSSSEKNALSFAVLSDVGNHVARRFGIVFELSGELQDLYRQFGHGLEIVNGPAGAVELPVPAVFVVGQDRRVLLAYADLDYTQRMDPAELVKFLDLWRGNLERGEG